MTAQEQAQANAQLNAYARAMIRAKAVQRRNQIYSGTFDPNSTRNLIVQPQNVGLIKGFWVQVVHEVSNASAVAINLTDFGPANALSQIQYDDLQNNTRIQTPGWHLAMVNSTKARRGVFGSSFVRTTGFDSPINFGNNFAGQISAPSQIAAAGTGTVTMWYWVPLAYSDDDLRGSVYANVINATQRLVFSMPGTNGVSVAVDNGTDSTLALFVGDVVGDTTDVEITETQVIVYQVYMDQIPVDPKLGLLLPPMDLATIYELKQTAQTGVVAGQDFNYQYPNFRDILSTIMIYVNTGATGARGDGTDLNYLSLQSANFTNIWKNKADLTALMTRNYMGVDTPPGTYYFGTREKPISTTQYGNMQLTINPLTAGAGAYQLVGVEDFALVQSLSMAGSLASN